MQVQWAPRVNVSARTRWHVDRLQRALDVALSSWEQRIPTSQLNGLLAEIVAAHPHPLRGGKQPRILFGTQAATRPPRFVLFTTGFLEAGYRGSSSGGCASGSGSKATPIEVSVRPREKRK